jgi:hypothetical protein
MALPLYWASGVDAPLASGRVCLNSSSTGPVTPAGWVAVSGGAGSFLHADVGAGAANAKATTT